MRRRHAEWFGRMVKGSLGWGAELWQPVDGHPAYDRVVAQLAQAEPGEGLPPNELSARYFLTRGLLADVIHAAGAIEYTVGKIEELVHAAQEAFGLEFRRDDIEDEWPKFGVETASPGVDDAYIEYANLLTWMRALDERVSHAPARAAAATRKLGLLPAIATRQPLKKRVQGAYGAFAPILNQERALANYVLHASAVPYAQSMAPVSRDWRIVVPIPDPPTQPIYTLSDLTFDQKRELVPFAQEVLAAVERFVDQLLAAFEAERVERSAWAADSAGGLQRWVHGANGGASSD